MSKYLCNVNQTILALVVALMITSFIGTFNVARAAETGKVGVRVVVDGESTYYETADKTVGQFLASENIPVGELDTVNVSMDAEVESSMRIVIDRPFEVLVSVDGGEYESVETNAQTVGKLIIQLRDNADETDYQTAEGTSSSTKLAQGTKVNLVSVTSKTFTKTETIPYSTTKVNTDKYFVGEEYIAQQGVDGEKTITMKSVYVGGALKETYSIDSTVTKTPIDKILEVGTKVKPAPVEVKAATTATATKIKTANEVRKSAGSAPKNYSSVITMSATAYCPCSKCCGSGACGITASGMRAGYGVCAVDKRVIPLGTKLYVEGYGYCIAADTGGAIKGNRIDLCYDTHYSALHSGYGHTPVKVYILN